jgi:hypothetical protein
MNPTSVSVFADNGAQPTLASARAREDTLSCGGLTKV